MMSVRRLVVETNAAISLGKLGKKAMSRYFVVSALRKVGCDEVNAVASCAACAS